MCCSCASCVEILEKKKKEGATLRPHLLTHCLVINIKPPAGPASIVKNERLLYTRDCRTRIEKKKDWWWCAPPSTNFGTRPTLFESSIPPASLSVYLIFYLIFIFIFTGLVKKNTSRHQCTMYRLSLRQYNVLQPPLALYIGVSSPVYGVGGGGDLFLYVF